MFAIEPGRWTASLRELRSEQNEYRREHGRNADTSHIKAEYRLVIAIVEHSFNNRDLGYADGESLGGKRSDHPMLVQERLVFNSEFADEADEEAARIGSVLLLELMEFLAERSQEANSAEVVLSKISDGVEFSTFLDVVRAASAWGLININLGRPEWLAVLVQATFGSTTPLEGIYRSASISVTDAGKIWNEAGKAMEASARRSRVNQPSGPTFNIDNTGGTIFGSTFGGGRVEFGGVEYSAGASVPPDKAAQALKELLRDPEIPWNRSEFAKLRQIVTDAPVEQAKESGLLATFLTRLGELASGIGIGIAGNAAYQLLLNFVSIK
ncbi:hypothetical protein [Cryptosporangium sp. NPDC051539]|uniref:hypothetical protein n=1 Tax=Cryptosporangium sp. NPDC051539 TaxID=3363962 RepID=UPI0037B81849